MVSRQPTVVTTACSFTFEYGSILLAILLIDLFHDQRLCPCEERGFFQFQGYVPDGLNDVLADEVVMLFVSAFSKTLFKMIENPFTVSLIRYCHLPDTLNTLSGGDEFPVFGMCQQETERTIQTILPIAFGKIAQYHEADGPLIGILVIKFPEQIIPDIIDPIHLFIRQLQNGLQCVQADLVVGGSQVVIAFFHRLVYQSSPPLNW
jgi:hypothetical protein